MGFFVVLVKPDAVLRLQCGVEIVKRVEAEARAKLVCFAHVRVNQMLAELHYEEHRGKQFFPGLVQYLTAEPGVYVMIYEGGEECLMRVRKCLDHPIVQKAREGSLRNLYGLIDGLNGVHCSDSLENGMKEAELWQRSCDLCLDESRARESLEKFLAENDGVLKINPETRMTAHLLNLVLERLVKTLSKETKADEKTIKMWVQILANQLSEYVRMEASAANEA